MLWRKRFRFRGARNFGWDHSDSDQNRAFLILRTITDAQTHADIGLQPSRSTDRHSGQGMERALLAITRQHVPAVLTTTKTIPIHILLEMRRCKYLRDRCMKFNST